MLSTPSEGGFPMTDVLEGVGTMLTWALGEFSDLTGWLVGDSLGQIYLAMFIIGFVIAAMFRLLHSA